MTDNEKIEKIKYYIKCHNEVLEQLPEWAQQKNDREFIEHVKALFKPEEE